MDRREVLARARELADERSSVHGDFRAQHGTAAALWSAYLGVPVTAEEVAVCLALLKLSRTQHGEANPDDWIDAVGYLAGAAECAGDADPSNGTK